MRKTLNNKGITLVALVITIIVLLILAGVSILALTQTGIFKNAKLAKNTMDIAKVEEELKTKIYEVQIEKNGTATLQDFIDCLDRDKENEYIISLPEIATISGVHNIGNYTEIYVIYKNYTFKVDQNLNIENIKNISQTEATYEVESNNGDVLNIDITIKNNIGIQKIVMPDQRTLEYNKEKEIKIKYQIEKNKKYEFQLMTDEDEGEVIVLDANKLNEIKIEDNEESVYPILSEYGLNVEKDLSIKYSQEKDNYYSLDDGKTWNVYSEKVNIKQDSNIKAKSLVKGEITKIENKEVKIQLASDALGINAYDKDMSTLENLKNYQKIFYVDEIAWNRKIRIYAKWSNSRLNYYIYDKNGSVLSSLTTDNDRITKTSTLEINIPQNAYKIGLYWKNASEYGSVNIQKIIFDNSPTVTNRYVYPVVTENGIKKEELYATVKYFKTSDIKKYKINDGEWQDYISEILYNVGDKLYIKGIDKNGEETFDAETKYVTGTNDDGVGKNAYDGDINTYITLSNKQRNLYIADNANLKAINVNMQLGDARLNYYIYDKDGNVLDSDTSDYNRVSTTKTQKINIPDNAYRIAFYWKHAGNYGYINIKEITTEYK